MLNPRLIKVIILTTLAVNSYSLGFDLMNILRHLLELSNQHFVHRYEHLNLYLN